MQACCSAGGPATRLHGLPRAVPAAGDLGAWVRRGRPAAATKIFVSGQGRGLRGAQPGLGPGGPPTASCACADGEVGEFKRRWRGRPCHSPLLQQTRRATPHQVGAARAVEASCCTCVRPRALAGAQHELWQGGGHGEPGRRQTCARGRRAAGSGAAGPAPACPIALVGARRLTQTPLGRPSWPPNRI